MFLTRAQIRTLTGLPSTNPAAQMRELDRRGIRHLGINAAGRLIVPVSATDASQRQEAAPWSPDFSKVGQNG